MEDIAFIYETCLVFIGCFDNITYTYSGLWSQHKSDYTYTHQNTQNSKNPGPTDYVYTYSACHCSAN